MQRRDWIRDGLRLVLTGGFLAAAGYLVATGRVSQGEDCTDTRGCGNCRWAADCGKKEKELNHGR